MQEDGALKARAILSDMPRPRNERQALERERKKLAGLLADYQKEHDATAPEDQARRERLGERPSPDERPSVEYVYQSVFTLSFHGDCHAAWVDKSASWRRGHP